MPQSDTIDKIVGTYFAAVTVEPFTYKGTRYEVRPLKVPTTIMRGFTCPSGCGGCCGKFTLDYLPSEKQPYPMPERWIDFDGRKVLIYSDTQKANKTDRCGQLNKEDGRCGIHGAHPFSCDFELLGVTKMETWLLSTRMFSRGWAMKRVDGGVGNLCELIPPTEEWRVDVIRRLNRLKEWTDHFGIETRLPTIVEWLEVAGRVFVDGHDVPDLMFRNKPSRSSK